MGQLFAPRDQSPLECHGHHCESLRGAQAAQKEWLVGQRKGSKKESMGAHPDRNAQFENIAQLKAKYLTKGESVLSIDTKKKELMGNFAREGHANTYTRAPEQTLDHDFPSAGLGKLIPHGLYDLLGP